MKEKLSNKNYYKEREPYNRSQAKKELKGTLKRTGEFVK
jgi:hypothetical protein